MVSESEAGRGSGDGLRSSARPVWLQRPSFWLVLAGYGGSARTQPRGTTRRSRQPATEHVPRSRRPVSVDASIGVAPSPAVSALVAFVQAHAESIDSGRVTPLLVAVTTPAELARQRRVVAFAVAQGYVVPTAPEVRVVTRDPALGVDRGPGRVLLAAVHGVPSTPEPASHRTGRTAGLGIRRRDRSVGARDLVSGYSE